MSIIRELLRDGPDRPTHGGILVPASPSRACEMRLRIIGGERCRRSWTTEWYGYRVCSACALALEAEGYPKIPS